MSAGMIWYKTQPDASAASALNNLYSDFCGSIKSHDTTVRPQKIPLLLKNILARSSTVIIVGGLDEDTPEQNIIFLLSNALHIPLETQQRSRSRYIYDKLHSVRLPSLQGSVLFPCRFGGPEGILLIAGEQTIIVLPKERQAVLSTAKQIHRFLEPEISDRRFYEQAQYQSRALLRDYERLRRSRRERTPVRVYEETELKNRMETVLPPMADRQAEDEPDFVLDDSNRSIPPSRSFSKKEWEYYRKRAERNRVKNVFSLVLVLCGILLLIVYGCFR